MLDDKQIQLLEILHEATRRNLINWHTIEDDERDVYGAFVDGEEIVVEILCIPIIVDQGAERGFVRFSGFKTYFTYAVGTRGYNLIMNMLSMQIFGWVEGTESALKRLTQATGKIQTLLQKQIDSE